MIKNHIVYNEFSNYQFKHLKAKESYIWVDDGRKLIDFTSAWNVTNLGWNNEEIHRAMKEELEKGDYVAGYAANDIQEKYAEELIESLPKGLDAVCKATGGTEANEEALKIAWAATGRKKIVCFKNTYHGQSLATMSLGYSRNYLKKAGVTIPGFIQLDFPHQGKTTDEDKKSLQRFVDNLDTVLRKKDVAAVFTEAGIITGWGTTDIAPDGYLSMVGKLTKQYGTLLIIDEVGTGFSRCGKLFGIDREKVTPDIVTFAKGMSNGAAAIGACITRSELAEAMIKNSQIYSTFGWNPVACAAALKTLGIHRRDKVWELSEKHGQYLRDKLQESLKNHPRLGFINGLGMEIGVHFVKNKKSLIPDNEFAKEVINRAFKNGLHLTLGGDGNIQVMPPLTTSRDILDKGIEIFVRTTESLQ